MYVYTTLWVSVYFLLHIVNNSAMNTGIPVHVEGPVFNYLGSTRVVQKKIQPSGPLVHTLRDSRGSPRILTSAIAGSKGISWVPSCFVPTRDRIFFLWVLKHKHKRTKGPFKRIQACILNIFIISILVLEAGISLIHFINTYEESSIYQVTCETKCMFPSSSLSSLKRNDENISYGVLVWF